MFSLSYYCIMKFYFQTFVLIIINVCLFSIYCICMFIFLCYNHLLYLYCIMVCWIIHCICCMTLINKDNNIMVNMSCMWCNTTFWKQKVYPKFVYLILIPYSISLNFTIIWVKQTLVHFQYISFWVTPNIYTLEPV